MCRLDGKIVLITGSSSGIGAETAKYFAQIGVEGLTITGRNAEALEKVHKACVDNGIQAEKVLTLTGDVTDATFREKLVNETIAKFGRLDVLVNNVGMWSTVKLQAQDLSEFDKLYEINVKSLVHFTQLAIVHLEKVKGVIVNVSTVASLRPMPGVYPLTRSAVDMYTQSCALELGPRGIRVNSVHPAVTDTPMVVRTTGLAEDTWEKEKKAIGDSYPLCRLVQPIDVAKAIAFLASDDSASITGTLLAVDAGFCLTNGSVTIREKTIDIFFNKQAQK